MDTHISFIYVDITWAPKGNHVGPHGKSRGPPWEMTWCSFAIGGALVAVAIVTRLTLILPIIAFAMMISSLSDIIQVIYCRFSGGKRIFRMVPLHHHFELSGIPETKIVSMYNVMTALLCILALLGYVK